MACKNDQSWGDNGDETDGGDGITTWNGQNIVSKDECIVWGHLLQLRDLYNKVYEECKKYDIELILPTGRPKYGMPGHREELEPLATIQGFFSIKLTPGANPQFEETRFIITGGTINDRIPAPNGSYSYAANDYGPWIVYIKSDCYGCGGWELDRSGAHYPRYRCCSGNSCADMDPQYWKSQNYVGRTTSGGICNFGREWGSQYMDVMNHCIAICNPATSCVCDSWPPCDRTVLECCHVDAGFHYSNWYDTLGPSGAAYGNPNCNANSEICPQNAEKRGIKWIGSHEPSSGYQGYVTQVIKAKHLSDIWTAIQPALNGPHRMGTDWYFCKGKDPTKKWKKDDNVDWEDFRYRFNACQKCDAPPAQNEPICACEINDLSYVLNKMLNNTCICDPEVSEKEYAGKKMWRIITEKTPTKEECLCAPDCDYEVWRFTASQSLVGYTPFVCENAVTPEDTQTRYLQYRVSCSSASTGTWCGGASQPGESVTVTTNIDPYTGLSCTTGMPKNGYVCAGGEDCKETCSETSQGYTCSARPEDCAGEGTSSISTKYSLSNQNTKELVLSRAQTLLGNYSMGSLPGPNTSGEVKVQTGGGSVLAWSPYSGEATASRWSSYGVAELTKSIVKLKKNLRYKITSYDESGNSSEQEYDGQKNQIIYINPPTGSDGSKNFSVIVDGGGVACRTVDVSLEVSSQNQLTTKTLRVAPPPSDGDDPEDQPCKSFLIGPDCKSYMHSLYSITGSSGMSWSYTGEFNCEPTFGSGTMSSGGTWTWQTTACGTTKFSPNPHYSSQNRYDSWGDVTFNEMCTNGSLTRTVSNAEGSDTVTLQVTYCSSQGWGNEPHGTHCFPLYGANCGTDTQGGTYEHSGGTSTWTRTCTENTKDSTTTRTLSENDSFYSSTPEWEYEHQGKTKTCPGTMYSSSGYRQNTVKITYSDEVRAAFDDENQNFETESWSSSGSLCAWRILAQNGTMNEQSTNIDITVYVYGDEEKSYQVKIQKVIQTDTEQNNCSTRSFNNFTEEYVMKGGETRNISHSLSAGTNETKCMIHYSAVAYEIKN